MQTLYAEVLLSANEDAGDARSYFAQSLVLKPRDNARAAWGLALACRKPVADDEPGLRERLAERATSDLDAAYARAPPGMADIARRALAKLRERE